MGHSQEKLPKEAEGPLTQNLLSLSWEFTVDVNAAGVGLSGPVGPGCGCAHLPGAV